MPRRPHPKRLAKAQEEFKAAVTAYLESIGTRSSDFYDLELDTPAGLLRLTVYENWVATRFDDVKLATALTKKIGRPCNPYSGKWNFHYFDGTIESLNPDQVILDLSFYIDWLLNWESVAA
jgi:hypothetical protein